MKNLKEKTLKQLQEMPDSEIDYSDIAELDANFWKHAKVVHPAHKKSITLRLDDDIIDWFKKTGRGYQTRMNAVLKSYVKSK